MEQELNINEIDMSGLRFVLHDEYKMSVGQLAERLGMAIDYVSGVASGRKTSEPARQKILDALNLTPEQYVSIQGVCRVRRSEKETGAKQKAEMAFTARADRLNPTMIEDFPDSKVEKATDAELRQRKHIACGNRCDLCGVQCALGREILKRGILYGKKEPVAVVEDVQVTDDGVSVKAKLTEHGEEVIGYLTADENGEVVAMTVEEHEELMAREEASAEERAAEEYPAWMVELLLENAEPSNKEFIAAFFGANVDRMTAAQVADIKRGMVRFEKLRAEVKKELEA